MDLADIPLRKVASSPAKLIRPVFSKTSSTENTMLDDNYSEYSEPKDNEITTLKDQVNTLQQSLFSIQEVLQMKEKALANVYKEKEKILEELKKHKRANLNLRQQLEDEREYHMKEKEYYCREMTDSYKYRPKRGIIRNEQYAALYDNVERKTELDRIKSEKAKLKLTLNETLEANYNLSIKFLRMKNTKYSLRARYKKQETELNKVIIDLKQKLDDTKEEINYIINDKFRLPIPPSNKQYLQIVKQNTQFVHENLSLQIEISNLYNEIERLKAERLKYETKSQLKYLRKSKNKMKCDKTSQTNFEEKKDTVKECRSLIFREKEIDLTEKSSDIYSEMSTFTLNRYGNCNENTRIQSAPEILQDKLSNVEGT